MSDAFWLLVVLAIVPLQILSAWAGCRIAEWEHDRHYERRIREVLGDA